MTKILRNIIRTLLMQEARPEAVGAKPTQSGRGFGGRRVYDKKSGEAYDVVDYIPRDPSEEVQKVVLKPRGSTGKEIKVSYNDFLGKYSRHVGQPVQTPIGSESPNVAAWAWHELRGQGGASKGSTEYSRGPMKGRGAVDVDPETGAFVRAPSTTAIEGDPTIGTTRPSEEEVAMDKINLVAADEKLYDSLVKPYVDAYKELLKPSIVIAQKKIKEYGVDLIRSSQVEQEMIDRLLATGQIDEERAEELRQSGEGLDAEEIEWIKKTPASEVFAAIWELPHFHNDLVPEIGIPSQHVSSISTLVNAAGKLSVNVLDDKKFDDVIKRDPGFKVHLSKLKNDEFWNKLRKAAEQAGKYRGQL